MKRFFSLSLALLALLTTVSCGGKDENGGENPAPETNPLYSTQWEAIETITYENIYNIEVTVGITFNSDDTFDMTTELDFGALGDLLGMGDLLGDDYENIAGTWTYEDPTVYMTAEGETLAGQVNGDTLTFSDLGLEEYLEGDIVFTKK